MTNITTLRSGEHFVFKNFEWVCLDPNHPDGGVLAIMAEPWANVLAALADIYGDAMNSLADDGKKVTWEIA